MPAKIKLLLVTAAALISSTAGLSGTAIAAEPYSVWVRPSTGPRVQLYDCRGKEDEVTGTLLSSVRSPR
jgi:hypothetical protein